MLKLLLVDDEAHFVDSMAQTIPWCDVGIHKIEKSYSANEALMLMEQYSFDIVITDIQMPGMSGLELIENLKMNHSNIKTILLTGYADFEYAKRAIELQAIEYMLKPVKDEALLKLVGRIAKQTIEEKKEQGLYQCVMDTYKYDVKVLKEKLFLDAIEGNVNASTVAAKLAAYSIPLHPESHYILMLIKLEKDFHSYDPFSVSLFEYAITNIVYETVHEEDYYLWSSKDQYDHLTYILISRKAEEPNAVFQKKMAEVQAHVKKYLRGNVSISYCHGQGMLEGLSPLYQNAVNALTSAELKNHKGTLIKAEELESSQSIVSIKSLYEPPSILNMLEMGKWDKLRLKLQEIFDEISVCNTQEHLREVFFSLSTALSNVAHKNGEKITDIIGVHRYQYMLGKSFLNIIDLKQWVFSVIDDFKKFMEENASESRQPLVQKVQNYVQQNLGENLSLQMISDHVYLHPAHLSKVYKNETDKTLSEYICLARMEHAAHLLRSSNHKIYDISLSVGYPNANWFIKLFRRFYDLSPQEYRDKLR